jgi:hypothetical protein
LRKSFSSKKHKNQKWNLKPLGSCKRYITITSLAYSHFWVDLYLGLLFQAPVISEKAVALSIIFNDSIIR